MELMGKIMFIFFTLVMINYARTIGKYDVKTIKYLAQIYMIIAAVLAVQV